MQNILVSWTSNIAVTAIQITAYVTGTETVTHTNTDFLMYIEKIIQPEMESGVASFVNLSQKNPTSYTLQAYMQEGFAQRFKELNLMLSCTLCNIQASIKLFTSHFLLGYRAANCSQL